METILAIDLGKLCSSVCTLRRGSLASTFRTVKTNRQAFHDLFAETNPDMVLFEIGTSAGWVADMLKALRIPFQVANTNDEKWKWKRNKNKTDRRDAHKLAMMYVYGSLPTVYMPNQAVRQKRSLIQYRQSIVKRMTQSKNIIRALLQTQEIPMPRGKNAWTQKGMERLRSRAMPMSQIEDMEQLWRGALHAEITVLDAIATELMKVTAKLDGFGKNDDKVKRLQTIPGVGPRVSSFKYSIISCCCRLTQPANMTSKIAAGFVRHRDSPMVTSEHFNVKINGPVL